MGTAVQFTDPVTFHGEGAVWSTLWGGLRCVDMFAGDVLEIANAGSTVRHHLGELACMIRPIDESRSLVALERGVFVWHEYSGELEPIADDLVPEGVRLNEGTCTPSGDVLIGSVAWDARPGGAALVRVGRDGAVTPVLDTVSISNGLGYSPDGSTLYYNDSASGGIQMFDVGDDGGLSHRRRLATVETGGPDGLWVDELGGIWVAIYGAGAVHRYLPDGTLDEVVSVGARQVTSCTFGGADLSTLFITTSRENLAPDDDPLAGSIFRIDLELRGLPVLPYVPATTRGPVHRQQKEAP